MAFHQVLYFYSHAREGRDDTFFLLSREELDFYSHAREGRDYITHENRMNRTISTHTPARGVTKCSLRKDINSVISTHTPARGVTIYDLTRSRKATNFYSHAREGRDIK